MESPAQRSPESRSHLVLVTVGVLYVTQGIPLGFTMMALPAILRQAGASLEVIGFISVTMLPWFLKFLWAPQVDRRALFGFGRRRSWIVCCQSAMVVLLAVLAFLPITAVGPGIFIAVLLFANLLSATQDIATDGLAVDHLGARLIGWANGLQIGGFSLGMLLGGPLALMLYDLGGQAWALLALAAFVAAALVPVFAWPEPRYDPYEGSGPKEGSGDRLPPSFRGFLRRPGALIMLSVAALFYAPRMMETMLLKPYMVDVGLPLSTIGMISGTGMMVLTVSAGLLGGWLVTRFGPWRTAWNALVLSWVLGLLWIPVVSIRIDGLHVILTLTILTGLTSGLVYVAFFAVFMRWARGTQSGTDFTMLQCAETGTGIVAGPLVGMTAERFDYLGGFLLVSLVGAAAVLWITGARRRLPEPSNAAESILDTAHETTS